MVYALDVGYNQLAWQLRDDPRVVVMEKQNFRYSKPEDFDQGLPDFAMTDVSFISLDLIMPPMCAILKDKCDAVCLIKPQFEAGPEMWVSMVLCMIMKFISKSLNILCKSFGHRLQRFRR